MVRYLCSLRLQDGTNSRAVGAVVAFNNVAPAVLDLAIVMDEPPEIVWQTMLALAKLDHEIPTN